MPNKYEKTRVPPKGSDLTGVLVTGASSDIGKELCKRLEGRQLKVLGTYNTHRPRESDVILPPEGMDLSDDADLQKLRSFTEQHLHGPFAVVHCVGDFWEHVPLDRCSLERARRMVTSHYLTLYGVLHRLLPYMAKVGGGRVLALSCTSTGFNYPDMAAFTSAKAALETLIKCVANEWAPSGVAANAIALSTIGTTKVLDSPSKPMSDQEAYIMPSEAAEFIEELLLFASPFLSGNVVRPLKHSHTFYNTGYFQRNPRISSDKTWYKNRDRGDGSAAQQGDAAGRPLRGRR